jgi:DNA-binding FrmR family transcriptional regulator
LIGNSIDILDKVENIGIIYIPLPHGGGRQRDMVNQDALKRLKNIEGHVRGIEQMVENGEYCIDVIRQIQAVQAALDKVSGIILEGHLHSCVITAVRGEDPDERERVLTEITDVFGMKKHTLPKGEPE